MIVALLEYLVGYLRNGLGVEIPVTGELIWWLIPVVGIPYTIVVNKRNAAHRDVKTYTDKLSLSLWNYVLWLAVAAIAIGAVFYISGFNAWYVMVLFAFFVVGMAVSVQGMIIREKTLIWSGAFSVVCGGFLVSGAIVGATWLLTYTVPLFILAFVVMMIIPGYILNQKAKKE